MISCIGSVATGTQRRRRRRIRRRRSLRRIPRPGGVQTEKVQTGRESGPEGSGPGEGPGPGESGPRGGVRTKEESGPRRCPDRASPNQAESGPGGGPDREGVRTVSDSGPSSSSSSSPPSSPARARHPGARRVLGFACPRSSVRVSDLGLGLRCTGVRDCGRFGCSGQDDRTLGSLGRRHGNGIVLANAVFGAG